MIWSKSVEWTYSRTNPNFSLSFGSMAGQAVSHICASSRFSIARSPSRFQQGKGSNCAENPSLSAPEYQFNQQARETHSPPLRSCSEACPRLRIDTFSCHATQLSSSGGRPSNHSSRYIVGSLRCSLWRGICGEKAGSSVNWRSRGDHWKGHICKASGGSEVGSSEWMSRATPYEVLGVSADSSEQEIKYAFRARIKEYHPDVYQGLSDADAITQRLLQAYELLTGNPAETVLNTRRSFDPFEDPECAANDVFVNEFACIGRGCPYSCVDRAPNVFQFASETGCARSYNQESTARKGGYQVQLAVGQCPRNCIHYVTPEQRFRLEEILQSALLEGTMFSDEVAVMEGLIARARFENGRYNPPKRKSKNSDQWVDWY